MASRFPIDRFDAIPDDLLRVGAHRAPQKKGRGWIAFAWAALATGILVAVGVVALALFADSFEFSTPFQASEEQTPLPSASVSETVAPVLDPTIAITVLNGTVTNGLANTVGDRLAEEGWGGAAEGVGTRANAGDSDVASTVVFYNDPANEAAARALVEGLGVGTVRLSDDYPSVPITILVGADYGTPTE